MKLGIIVPQGWTGEYAGWDPAAAWERSLEIALEAEALGVESLWAYDHFHTTPDPTDEMTFESLTFLGALAARTARVRLGQVVACAGFRNPALLAKMISTLDVITGGRMELGIGAGWKREEWLAYGYQFPSTSERLAVLRDQLEVVTAMFDSGRASFDGEHASVAGAINLPRGVQQPRIPIMVGGNGRSVTWRLAARYADELNLDAVLPDDLPEALSVIAARCDEIGRDPASLAVSVHIWWEQLPDDPAAMTEMFARYADAGIARVQVLPRSAVDDREELSRVVEAARDAAMGPAA